MPFKGGFIRDLAYVNDEIQETEYQDVLIWGTVCKDAKVYKYKTKKAKHSMKVDVLLKYEGGKGGYLSVWAFKDTDIARQLSRLKWKDKVAILGTLITKTRYQDGETVPIKQTYLDPHMLWCQRIQEENEKLLASPKFQSMLEDEFESELEESTEEVTEDEDLGFV